MAEQSFSEVYLKTFIKHNPHCAVAVEDEYLMIEKPWSHDDARLKICVQEQEFISELNQIRFNPKFDAVFHDDLNSIEFLYGYLNPELERNKDIMSRKFTVHFEGKSFNCYFAEPTSRLLRIAASFERLPSDASTVSAHQIIPFKDGQNLEKQSDKVKEYFKGKIPRNFFIKANDPIHGCNLESLARHINFLLSYYDRSSPTIAIHEIEDASQLANSTPIRHIEGHFPETLLIQPIDDIVLKLIEVAKISQARFAFLYYYQVFEYAGYYYIDESTKKALKNHLKDPALINCGEEKLSDLFSIFSDINHNDDVKMKKVIEDHCDPSVIWKEIENDKEFFCKEHAFQGDFVLKALIANDTSEATWKAVWMPKLYDQLTKIRNSLVHARERRENKVILPTKANNKILNHYIPIIARVAEQIALKS